MSKKTYYVNLNPTSMEDISTTKIDDHELIEYEIEATPEEVQHLQQLMMDVQKHDMELADLFTFRHFNEEFTTADSDRFQHGMNDVYRKIYELGTNDTRTKMDSMHPSPLTNDE
ncbi:hypothetical protein [Natribacillus halophilus]|uniref:Uncharacterized protein n=1 Tax=Natribacillus halophilus TaxID=549003 RepID=A0A1G8R4V3_9BACI|nr:hypothetical protein [Natribacillus halophilus]SDJ12014.1 hypothetical protein SAMN04488123_11569 [Natribacillus halophilus]